MAPFKKYGAQLFGEDGNDRIFDTYGRDTVSGGNGNDLLISSGNHDVIDGGDGVDTLQLSGRARANAVTVVDVERFDVTGPIVDLDLNQFDFLVHSSISLTRTLRFTQAATLEHPELLGGGWLVEGSREDDILDVSQSKGRIKIFAGVGDDVVISDDAEGHLNGGYGNDMLTGGAARDTIFGEQGDDVIFGGAGRDYIVEEQGNNTVHGGDDSDYMLISHGANTLFGDDGDDRITVINSSVDVEGGAGDDALAFTIERSAVSVTASGGLGDDLFGYSELRGHATLELHGDGGQDTFAGGYDLSDLQADGIETLRLISSHLTISPDMLGSFTAIEVSRNIKSEVITLSEGDSLTWHADIERLKSVVMIGSSGADHLDLTESLMHWTIRGGTGDDSITGSKGVNVLDGGAGNDVLTGKGTWDHLGGEQGNDTLIGFGQEDFMAGGTGDDVLIFGGGLHQAYGNSGDDRFFFDDKSGDAIIYDFRHAGNEMDRIDFSKVSSIKDFQDLIKNHVAAYNNGVLIKFDSNEINLESVSPKELDASDFIF
jgi:Ca2+-binding RTX toxin-like protein